MKKKLTIYYIVIALVIVIGFVVGTGLGKKIYDRGYRYFYGPVEETTWGGQTIPSRKMIEVGDHLRHKYFGWYFLHWRSSDVYLYLIGDDIKNAIVLDYDSANDLVTQGGKVPNALFTKKEFEGVYYNTVNIIISIAIWIFMIVFPFIVNALKKSRKKTTVKKNLKKLRELDEMKMSGIISEDEYNLRKEQYIDKAKNNL